MKKTAITLLATFSLSGNMVYSQVLGDPMPIADYVLTVNGRMVSRYTTDLQKGNNRLPVDIRNAANGNYFIS